MKLYLKLQQKLAADWTGVSFGSVDVKSENGVRRFEVTVYLGAVDPGSVSVELFAENRNGSGPVRIPKERGSQVPVHGYLYSASVPGDRSASDFTPRVVPHHPSASVPLEASEIPWQR